MRPWCAHGDWDIGQVSSGYAAAASCSQLSLHPNHRSSPAPLLERAIVALSRLRVSGVRAVLGAKGLAGLAMNGGFPRSAAATA